MLGLKLAEVGTNSVVRRKTLFESAERADGLRIFLSEWTRLRGANPAAQIFSVFGRGYLTRAGAGGDRPLLLRAALRNKALTYSSDRK